MLDITLREFIDSKDCKRYALKRPEAQNPKLIVSR
jgi:hypothetical protein